MRVCVIGAGYVGAVTAACLAQKGHQVRLVESDQNRLQAIAGGKAPFHEPGLDNLLKEVLSAGNLSVGSDLSAAVVNSQLSFIAVGTPGTPDGIDLSQVKQAANNLGHALLLSNRYHVVVVKSTVSPGTTSGIVREEIERASGLVLGQFGLCMNPEFLREGSAVNDFMHPDRIVIGESDERSGQLLNELYRDFACPIVRTTLNNAELTKYASNSLLSLLISFSNELAAICESLPDADIDAVMNVLHLDKRLSPSVEGRKVKPEILSYLRAGCGFGGSCLPKDVNALREFAQKQNLKTPLLDAIMQVNEARPAQVVSLVEKQLGTLEGKVVTVLGLAFKPNTDDLRDSPALKITDCLIERKVQVRAYDPMITALNGKQSITIVSSPEAAFAGADAIIIATAWPNFAFLNFAALTATMRTPIVIDGRRLLTAENLPAELMKEPVAGFWSQLHKITTAAEPSAVKSAVDITSTRLVSDKMPDGFVYQPIGAQVKSAKTNSTKKINA